LDERIRLRRLSCNETTDLYRDVLPDPGTALPKLPPGRVASRRVPFEKDRRGPGHSPGVIAAQRRKRHAAMVRRFECRTVFE